MARSFYRSLPGDPVKDFYHKPSDTHYSQSVRAGRYYQRRWQIGPDGREINSEELPVDYVMGSGNHARTYLSRKTNGALIELPLAWYSEKGGYWAMNPGYDTPHPPSHRLVAYECMFCHNSYPRIPVISCAAGAVPVYAGDSARRNRLPTLPWSRLETYTRRAQRNGVASNNSRCDRQSRTPDEGPSDGGVHAMPPADGQHPPSGPNPAFRPRAFFLHSGPAVGELHSFVRSRAGTRI